VTFAAFSIRLMEMHKSSDVSLNNARWHRKMNGGDLHTNKAANIHWNYFFGPRQNTKPTKHILCSERTRGGFNVGAIAAGCLTSHTIIHVLERERGAEAVELMQRWFEFARAIKSWIILLATPLSATSVLPNWLVCVYTEWDSRRDLILQFPCTRW
jgi:hypothetical protein